jgi:hypothetical protein
MKHPNMMRHSILLGFLAPLTLAAQQQVMIADATALNAPTALRKDRAAATALQATGLPAEQQALILDYGDPEDRPPGLREDSLRRRNEPYIQNYACFRVATFPDDSVKMTILMVPAKENIHMPEDMRPLADFYLVLPEKALSDVNTGRQRPEISRGPRWKNLAPARILLPEELYGTYDLADDSIGMAALRARGMSQAEIDAVVFRCTDRNWPDGIDSYEKRQALLPKFTKYKAFLGARWGDKVLLIVPVEKNRKLPILMRPYVDLYFVYKSSAVEVKKKKRR